MPLLPNPRHLRNLRETIPDYRHGNPALVAQDGLRSTKTQVRVAADGGAFGGVMVVESENLERLRSADGTNIPAVRQLAPHEKFSFAIPYAARRASSTNDDIRVISTIVEATQNQIGGFDKVSFYLNPSATNGLTSAMCEGSMELHIPAYWVTGRYVPGMGNNLIGHIVQRMELHTNFSARVEKAGVSCQRNQNGRNEVE